MTREEFFQYALQNKLYTYLPMPKAFYKEMNVPEPTPMEFKEFLPIASRAVASCEVGEIRPIAEGGLRPVPEVKAELAQLEIKDTN